MITKPKQRSFLKKKFLIPVILVVLALGAVVFAVTSRRDTENQDSVNVAENIASGEQEISQDINYDPPTADEERQADAQKDEIIRDAETPPAATAPTVTITRANQPAPSEALAVRVLVGGTTTGTCQVNLSQTGQVSIYKSYPVVFEATSSTCPGINIAASEFPTSGSWKLTVSVTADGQTSPVATRTVEVSK